MVERGASLIQCHVLFPYFGIQWAKVSLSYVNSTL